MNGSFLTSDVVNESFSALPADHDAFVGAVCLVL